MRDQRRRRAARTIVKGEKNAAIRRFRRVTVSVTVSMQRDTTVTMSSRLTGVPSGRSNTDASAL